MDDSARVVADIPCLVFAYRSGSEVGVRNSPIVKDFHPQMEDIWKELVGQCYSVERFEMSDETMMYGRAVNRTFTLHQHCPAYQHNCAVEVSRRL
jgi:hypothetical protein